MCFWVAGRERVKHVPSYQNTRGYKSSFLFLNDGHLFFEDCMCAFPLLLMLPYSLYLSLWLSLLVFRIAKLYSLTFFRGAVCGYEVLFYLLWKAEIHAFVANCNYKPMKNKAADWDFSVSFNSPSAFPHILLHCYFSHSLSESLL